MNNISFHQPATDIAQALNENSYDGQPSHMKIIKYGNENSIAHIPIFLPSDPTTLTSMKELVAKEEMKTLAEKIAKSKWVDDIMPAPGEFKRVILSMGKQPNAKNYSEIVLALWGKGFVSPVHGHISGYTHEEVIKGRIMVNRYRLVNKSTGVVRLIGSEIFSGGTFASKYLKPNPDHTFERQHQIHSFIAIDEVVTMHYIPEHSRDGMGNTFTVEYFEQFYDFSEKDFTRITSKDGMYLRKGDVVLVRSQNVPEYGDHFIVITGAPTMKEHGLRPREVAFHAPYSSDILNAYEPETGLTLLKLNDQAKIEFHLFHDIAMENGEVILPTGE